MKVLIRENTIDLLFALIINTIVFSILSIIDNNISIVKSIVGTTLLFIPVKYSIKYTIRIYEYFTKENND